MLSLPADVDPETEKGSKQMWKERRSDRSWS